MDAAQCVTYSGSGFRLSDLSNCRCKVFSTAGLSILSDWICLNACLAAVNLFVALRVTFGASLTA